MSAEEFAMWCAEYQLQPFGEFPADVRSAINGATVANAMGAKVDVEDLLPKWDRDPVNDQKAKAELFILWCEAHNRREAAKQKQTAQG